MPPLRRVVGLGDGREPVAAICQSQTLWLIVFLFRGNCYTVVHELKVTVSCSHEQLIRLLPTVEDRVPLLNLVTVGRMGHRKVQLDVVDYQAVLRDEK
jgi:hypothetical protein